MRMFNKNLYEILEVSPNASKEVIKNAYRALAKKLHPDTYPEHLKKEAESKLKELNLVYEILIDSTKRADYDRNYRGTKSDFTKHSKEETSTNIKSDGETRERRSERRNMGAGKRKGIKVSNAFALVTIICILIIAVLGKVASLNLTLATNTHGQPIPAEAQFSQQFTLPSQSTLQPRSQATHSRSIKQSPKTSLTEVEGL